MKHEYQQAHHNYEFDMGLGFQISARGEGHKEYLIETETTSLKTSRYDCIEDNSMLMKECIDDFIAEELNCSLPWTNSKNGLRICQSEEDLVAFRTLSFNITSPYLRQKLSMKGCFRPNCKLSRSACFATYI